jgi:hypothetical protein
LVYGEIIPLLAGGELSVNMRSHSTLFQKRL